jgi:hypothetical protein
MALEKRRERQLGRLAAPRRESLQQLPVRQPPDRPDVEQCPDVPGPGIVLPFVHALAPRAIASCLQSHVI